MVSGVGLSSDVTVDPSGQVHFNDDGSTVNKIPPHKTTHTHISVTPHTHTPTYTHTHTSDTTHTHTPTYAHTHTSDTTHIHSIIILNIILP